MSAKSFSTKVKLARITVRYIHEQHAHTVLDSRQTCV